MIQTFRDRRGGFTLIELLVVVAVIGIIAAILLPSMLDALKRAKQVRTVADIRTAGSALMNWLTDQFTAAAAGSPATTVDITEYPLIDHGTLNTMLIPEQIQKIPERDGWKNMMEYRLETVNFTGKNIAIRSPGEDGVYDTSTYAPGSFEPTDYDQDIVWTDGFFVRWPQKLTS